ncbi:anti-sigma factor [Corynebacterium heidelbergense]|uniref:anti-sigma factor n=1 Tax=Corynebacterium heidelbergense TaxID=2055947 RepID=UPI0015EE6845|nr:anti-sigma factor [Corynebacterium heidelbergense]
MNESNSGGHLTSDDILDRLTTGGRNSFTNAEASHLENCPDCANLVSFCTHIRNAGAQLSSEGYTLDNAGVSCLDETTRSRFDRSPKIRSLSLPWSGNREGVFKKNFLGFAHLGRLTVAMSAAACLLILYAFVPSFHRSETTIPPEVVLSSAELESLDGKNSVGSVELIKSETDSTQHILVQMPGVSTPKDQEIEVWLLNKDGQRMISLGLLNQTSGTSLPVTDSVLESGYTVVDVSNETLDGDPLHSGHSIARAAIR